MDSNIKIASAATLKAELEERMKAIAAERDKLRAVISDFEELQETCDSALEHLEIATDALSGLV